ncbi:MAG: ATP-binding protein [Deltaproteobacteria bacterium]|nr:ATP-binding protein [Deltaproteobacteria bacterium]
MGETRVDLLHLLEDLRDAYPGSLEETILTEIMANALDSGASSISFECDLTQSALTTVDNGSGMQRRELARFHDIAASTKTRGQGIGFAGVGIKLGLLICEEVLTETRRGKTHVASSWHMASRHRAPWKWVPAPGLVVERGTAVRLKVRNALSPLLDPGFLEVALRRHYQPLLDPAFDEFLSGHYSDGVAIQVNGRRLEKRRWSAPLQAPLEIRLLRKRKPSAFGYLIRGDAALPEDQRGLAISTYGKVIRRGWDWLGMTPSAPEHIGGLIEVPELAACLTLNKGDFLRTGPRGATYLAYRKAIQEAVAKQLSAWGDVRPASKEAPPREVRPLQRDLAHLLEDLAIDFPLLASLVERRAGGQKRLALGGSSGAGDGRAFVSAVVAETLQAEAQMEDSTPETSMDANGDESQVLESPEPYEPKEPGTVLPGSSGARRPAHYGLDIQFEDRPDDVDLGRLMESTVWVNRAHPAYRRALASRSIGYHIALSVAMSLAPLAVEAAEQNGFVVAFLSRWGEALDKPANRKASKH